MASATTFVRNAGRAAAAGVGGHTGSRLLTTSRSSCNGLHALAGSQSVERSHVRRTLGGIGATAFATPSSRPDRRMSNLASSWPQHHRFVHRQQQLRQSSLPQIFPRRHRSSSQVNDADVGEFFANPESFPDFASMGITSPRLLDRLHSPPNSLKRPSAVQAAAFDAIRRGRKDVIVGAETGSGKTLAYLLPLVDDILRRKREWKAKANNNDDGETTSDGIMDPGYDYARAIVLVPNKELAHQAVRMAASVCGGLERCVVWGADAMGIDDRTVPSGDVPEEDIVRLAILPGGLSSPKDFPPFRFAASASPSQERQPPPDLVFATPANLGPMALSPKNIDLFADVATLVVDEADMLLDGGYIRQLNNVLMGFRRADRLLDGRSAVTFRRKLKGQVVEEDNADDEDNESWDEENADGRTQIKTQHVFVAATLPDYGLRSVDAYLRRKFPNATNITMAGMHNARHYGLEDESRTIWNEIEDNKERMQRLVDVLRLDRSEMGVDGRGLNGEKVMVFLNTVKDVDGAANALRRAGIDAVPYHSKMSLEDRTSNLDKFRRYRAPTTASGEEGDETINGKNAVPVLVCTDVASRGLDVPGVTAIVQLQFAQDVVAHLHRMGRCGRAGNRDGRGIIFHGAKQRELVAVVREAEEQQSRMTLVQDVEDHEMDDDLDLEGDEKAAAGKVEKAFSRKRGFTKKRKKQRKRANEAMEGASEYIG